MTYAQRRARGLCARCPQPSETHTLCLACRIRDSAVSRRRYQVVEWGGGKVTKRARWTLR